MISRLALGAGLLGADGPPLALVALLGVVALAVIGSLASALWLARRRFGREVAEIIESLEELRSGRAARRCGVEAGSALGLVSDAVNRLGFDLQSRRIEAETAAERWKALTDAARDTAVVMTDTDGDVRSFSAGAAELFGWETDEVLGRPAAVLFEETSYRDLLPKLARKSLRTQGVRTRSRLVRRDGSEFPGEVSVRMLSGSGPEPVGFVLAVRDLSEQLEVEENLRAAGQRFRSLVEGLGNAVLIVRGGRILYANPPAVALAGLEPREIEGRTWRDRVAAADLLVVEEAVSDVEHGRAAARDAPATLVAAGGRAVRTRLRITPVEYEGERAALLLAHDEAEAGRATARLERNEARLDAVLEAAADGILVLSEERGGVVRVANRAAARLLGVPLEELLGIEQGRLVERLRSGGEGPAAMAERLGSPGRLRGIRLPGLDGAGREVEVVVAPLVARSGESLGKLVVCRDRSEQRESEQRLQEQAQTLQLSKLELEQASRELRETNAALRARGDELDQLNRELRRLDEMKSNLLGNVSHELQTPLVSIRGYTEMILKERLGPVTEEQRKGLSLALRNIDRLIAMIDNLLAFARTDAAEALPQLQVFELKPLIEEGVELLREKMAELELAFSLDVADPGLRVEADRDRLLQVLVNLLSNATKFNRRRGRIEVAVRSARAGYARVEVRDTGVGIPQEELGRIFDRRYRAGRGAGEEAGSGLGLAIARDILRLHGCTIEAESEEGRGTVVRFEVPLPAAQDTAAGAAPAAHADSAPPGEPVSRGEGAGHGDPGPPRPRLRIIRRREPEG